MPSPEELETVRQAELYQPRSDSIGGVELLGNLTEIHGINVLVAGEEGRMVEQVVRVGPEIDMLTLLSKTVQACDVGA